MVALIKQLAVVGNSKNFVFFLFNVFTVPLKGYVRNLTNIFIKFRSASLGKIFFFLSQ